MRCRKLHQVHGFSCKSGLREFRAVIFLHFPFLLLTVCHGGHSQAINRPPPLKAKVGDHVTLPCHVKQAVDTDHMLEWSRPDLDPRFVHVRRFGGDWVGNQNQLYTGRTSVSIEGLRHGDCSLKLSRVKLSDQGTYRCFIPSLNTDINVQLLVDEFYKNSSSSPDPVDPVKPVKPVDSVDPVLIAVVVGILLLLPVVIFVVWKRRQNNTRKRPDDEEPQTDDPQKTPLMKGETDGELQTAGGEMMKSPNNEEDDYNFKMSKEETGLVHQQHETGSKTNLDQREAEKPSVSVATGWSTEEKKTGQTLISDELQVSCSADMNQDRTKTQTGVKEQEENETTDVTGDQEPESSDKPMSDENKDLTEPVTKPTNNKTEETGDKNETHEGETEQDQGEDEKPDENKTDGMQMLDKKEGGVNEQKENNMTSVTHDQEPSVSAATGWSEEDKTRQRNHERQVQVMNQDGQQLSTVETETQTGVNEQKENETTDVTDDQEPESSDKPLSAENKKDLTKTEAAGEKENGQDKTNPTNTETQETEKKNDQTDGRETEQDQGEDVKPDEEDKSDGEQHRAGRDMMKNPDNIVDDNNINTSKEETRQVHQQHETGSKTNLDQREAEKPSVSAATSWSEEEKTGQTLISDELQDSCSADMNQDRTETQTGVKEREENKTTDVTGDQEPESSDKPMSDENKKDLTKTEAAGENENKQNQTEPVTKPMNNTTQETRENDETDGGETEQDQGEDEKPDEEKKSDGEQHRTGRKMRKMSDKKEAGVEEQKEKKSTFVTDDQEQEDSKKPQSDENKKDLTKTEAAGEKENGQEFYFLH